ncbi:uncharacterized protein [Triticum aestivum]|uniref:uncharacterized protein n=1 Tax=Triticum aestivum TaxID=4565 RepID=UPI001D01703F|nr:uncharacterized protein LOC123135585 [Triticum aestivum]
MVLIVSCLNYMPGSARGVPNLEVRRAFTTGASATRTRLAFHLRWCSDDLLKYGSARFCIERWSMAMVMRIAEHAFSVTAHTLRYFRSIGLHKYYIQDCTSLHPEESSPTEMPKGNSTRHGSHTLFVVSLLPVLEEKMASFPWGCTSVQSVSYK